MPTPGANPQEEAKGRRVSVPTICCELDFISDKMHYEVTRWVSEWCCHLRGPLVGHIVPMTTFSFSLFKQFNMQMAMF